MEPFRHTFRVRYAEVDPQSVVFNSRYLEYADLMVSEHFREARGRGMPPDAEFHVRRAEVDYLAPIRFDEVIEGRLVIEAFGRTSMTTQIALHCADQGDLRAEIRLVSVHVDLPAGSPTPIPDAVREALSHAAAKATHA